MATLSVVIPTRDRARFLPDAVDSALSQSGSDLELIVVDDGSTDGTAALLARRYGAALRVEHLEQSQGPSAARNAGVAVATGELVAFLDSDDVWLPEKLERQLPLFTDPSVDLVHGWTEPIDEHGDLVREEAPALDAAFRRALARGYDYPGVTETWCMLVTSTVVVRRSALEAAGAFDPSLRSFEDWDLWWRMALEGRIATVPEAVVAYRIHGGNTDRELRASAPEWVRMNRKHLDLVRARPDRAQLRRGERNLCVNLALGEHWRERPRESRRWMRRALMLDPGLLRRPAHPVWHEPLLSTVCGPRLAPRVHRRLARYDAEPRIPFPDAVWPSPLDLSGQDPFAPRPSMTIVIISYQRRAALHRLLRSLCDAMDDPRDRDGLDVLVLLDGSDDGSCELVTSMDLPVPHRVVWQENAGRAAARNAGLAAATGDIVLFLDDDGIATPGLVAAHRALHRADASHPHLVIGPCDFREDADTLPILLAHSRRHHAELARHGRAVAPYHVTFANTSAPRRLLLDVGGFDPAFAGWGAEDGELGARLLARGTPVLYHPGAVVWHAHRGTREGFLRTRRELGTNTARLLDRHPELARDYLVPRSRATKLLVRACRPQRPAALDEVATLLYRGGELVHGIVPGVGLQLMWASSDLLQAAGMLEADPSGRWLRAFASGGGRG